MGHITASDARKVFHAPHRHTHDEQAEIVSLMMPRNRAEPLERQAKPRKSGLWCPLLALVR